MIKVCFITNNVNQWGGLDRVLAQIVNYCSSELEYQVTILSLFSENAHTFFPICEAVQIQNAGLSLGDNVAAYLSEYISQNTFTHYVTLHAYISFEVTKITLPKKTTWIATEHVSPLDYTFKRRLANLYTYMRADRLVLLTESAAKYYRRRGIRNVEVIPNPVSFTSEQVSPLTAKTIVAVGRLEVVKRFDQCIRAFSEVVSAHPEYTLKIVGSGSQEAELKTLAASLGIENSVEFTGVQKNVKEILLDASLMAITSEYEGFSIVALESLECGLPVVAFELPSVREIDAASGAISFVPQGDWKALAAEMNRLIDNREQLVRAGRASKTRAAEYEPNKIGNLWRSLIERKMEN